MQSLRTLAVVAAAALVWLGYRRAAGPIDPTIAAAPRATASGFVAPDGRIDLVLEARDRAGRPVSALDVTLESATGANPDARLASRALESETGRFELDGLAPGAWRLTVTAPTRRVLEPLPGTWLTLPTARAITVVTEAPAALEVEIVDHRGRPMPGVEVLVRPTLGEATRAATDALGRVAVGALAAGLVELDATALGARVRERIVLAPEARTVTRLRLPGGSLAGELRDAAGQPEPGVVVEVLTVDPPGRRLAAASTDGRGRFEVPWLPPGRALVRAVDGPWATLAAAGEARDQRPGGPTQSTLGTPSAIVAVPDGGAAEARLRRSNTRAALDVRGVVRWGQEPLPELELTFVAADGRLGGSGGDGAALDSRLTRVDRAGHYRLELPHRGPWVVLGALPGRAPLAFGSHTLDATGAATLDLDAPVGTLQGRVLDERGRGLAGARIEAISAAPWLPGALHAAPRAARAAADGTFEVVGLLAGPWTVYATPAERPAEPSAARARAATVEVRPDRATPALDLVAQRAGALLVRFEGLTLDTGDEYVLELRDAAGRAVLAEGLRVRGGLSEGVRIDGLAPGSYRCAARSSLRVSGWSNAAAVAPRETAEVTVAPRPGATVTVLVQDPAGAPVPAALELLDEAGADVTRLADPRAEGRHGLTLGPLPPGRYTCVAHAVDGTTARRELALAAGTAEPVVLRTGD